MKQFFLSLKRAFTIVELVVVIAVIAILAAVLIPSFVSIIDSAHFSVALENCRNALLQLKTVLDPHGRSADEFVFVYDRFAFLCMNDQLESVDFEHSLFSDSANVFDDYLLLDHFSLSVDVYCPDDLCPHPSSEQHLGVAPSCFSDGYADYSVCTTCERIISAPFGSVLSDITLPKLDHEFDDDLFCVHCSERSDITPFLDLSDNRLLGIGDRYRQERLSCVIVPHYNDGIPVTRISSEAFAHCDFLQSIFLPASVTDIGVDCFLDCTALRSVSGMDGVTRIRANAFSGCSSLQEISLPVTLKSIGGAAFSLCSNLRSVSFQGTVAQWLRIDCPDGAFPTGCSILCSDSSVTL